MKTPHRSGALPSLTRLSDSASLRVRDHRRQEYTTRLLKIASVLPPPMIPTPPLQDGGKTSDVNRGAENPRVSGQAETHPKRGRIVTKALTGRRLAPDIGQTTTRVAKRQDRFTPVFSDNYVWEKR